MRALLDTHVLIWWLDDRQRLSRSQQEAIAAAGGDSPLLVSDVSLWEVAMLHGRGRIRLAIPLREWLEAAVAPPLVRRCAVHGPVVEGAAGEPAGIDALTSPSWMSECPPCAAPCESTTT